MKICVLTQTFPRFETDTAAPFMRGFCEGLVKAGNEVIVLAPYSDKYKRPRKKPIYTLKTYKYVLPKSFHTLGYSQTLVNDKRLKYRVAILAPLMFFFGFIALVRLVRKEKIDVVSAHWILPNGFIAGLAHVVTRVRIVCTLPGSDVYVARKKKLFKIMALFAARQSIGITSNSLDLKKDLESLGATIKNFKMIVYSVDTHVFKPLSKFRRELLKKYNLKSNAFVIVSVGRLVEKKGFMYLIKAAPSVVRKHKNVQFFMVGSGSQLGELKEEVAKQKVLGHFTFVGNVSYDALVKYYNFCDLFILPSIRDQEGNLDDQSVAVVEAMACGKPVITTNFAGYKYVITDGEDGLLVEEKDTLGITRAINKVIENKKFAEKLGRNAREKVISKFSWVAVGHEYTEFFKSL